MGCGEDGKCCALLTVATIMSMRRAEDPIIWADRGRLLTSITRSQFSSLAAALSQTLQGMSNEPTHSCGKLLLASYVLYLNCTEQLLHPQPNLSR
jgi:hypothetical protein